MVCLMCETPHGSLPVCPRLHQLALSLNLFAVPAFVTDALNRFIYVNERFARMIGDPIGDRLPPNMRFLPSAILGPYRDRFPQGRQEVAQCASGLFAEVDDGRLATGAARLLQDTLGSDRDLNRLARRTETAWDGTLVVKSRGGEMSMVREQVVSLADAYGGESKFHISLWLAADQAHPQSLLEQFDRPAVVGSKLTSRQLEIARWYAAGLTSRGVGLKAKISMGPARAHLEDIYSRLDIHSRAELTALLVREGLA